MAAPISKKKARTSSARKRAWVNPDSTDLFGAILQLKNVNEARRFFRDLLTEDELLEFGNRWKAARLLAQKVSYREIARQTGLSSATIARVKRWLTRGMHGYLLLIDRTGRGRFRR